MSIELWQAADACLMGIQSMLGWLLWRQQMRIGALETSLRATEISTGIKLALLEHKTCFDAKTGLRNELAFSDELAARLRDSNPLALIYIDLDGLKRVNTEAGHHAGDKLIELAARAIRCSLRRDADRNKVFRRGCAADEFLVLLDSQQIDAGIILGEQILTTLRSQGITASVGVTWWDGLQRFDGGTLASVEDIERFAELQMERAKQAGRDCVRWALYPGCQPLPPRVLIEQTVTVERLMDEGIPLEIPTEQNERFITVTESATKRHAA